MVFVQAEMDSMRLEISSLQMNLRAEEEANAAWQKSSMEELDQLTSKVVHQVRFSETGALCLPWYSAMI